MAEEKEIPKTYSPEEVDAKWYDAWEKAGHFKPRKGKRDESFVVLMPPPNVTGRLHMGHALDATTQDVLIRYKRMKGYETLWIPGMDHAGIATQSVVEKMVWDQEKKTRHDFERDDFVKKIWEWKEEYGGIIANQQRKMGASADWDYFMFTMDEIPNLAVRTFFVNMYNEGLIYQSNYIVNWDPVLQSAISDAEVEHKEVKGAFYHIKYKIKDSNEELIVATTRPETMLGDTGVAVNPTDDRFKHLIGKKAIVPLCNREVPIVGDEHVDVEKGTGCLKVTPGHDFNDFDIGQRHNLPVVNILNKDGTLNEYGLEWQGQTCKQARPKIVEKLEELGLLTKVEEVVHQVGHGDRSKAIIEPMVSKQWFLNVQEMAKDAVEAVETDKTRFWPKSWENTLFSWLREPKDWCISRQLWWGHQIPVYYCDECEHQWASIDDPAGCAKCSSKKFHQDPDVLDTWFSSGLWPLSTLGWPDEKAMKERNFERFFPNSTLVTGFDIIFFWVARMMMMSLKAVNSVPFTDIYIHAIVRDKLGRKMSKSLGNGIDPLEMIDQYGADALRFTLAAGSGYNRGLNLDPERISGYRNYINKIWNAFRFIHRFLEEAPSGAPELKELDTQEKWILAELNQVAKSMNEAQDVYRFDDACHTIYSFTYDKFCSWFIELSKPILYGDDEKAKEKRAQVLKYSFRQIVALLHPTTPYITEELWSYLKEEKEDLLIVQQYPEYDASLEFPEEREMMNKLIDSVTGLRNLRAQAQIKPKDEVKAFLKTKDADLHKFYEANASFIHDLARAHVELLAEESEPPKGCIFAPTTHTEVYMPLDEEQAKAQKSKLEKELTKAEKEYAKYDKKLSNPKFLDNAKPEIVEEVKAEAKALQEKLTSIKANLDRF